MSKAVPVTEGIAPTLLETPWSPRPDDRLGFYGCSAGGGRIVRVGLLGRPRRKPPRSVTVPCPSCGMPHTVEPIWRRPGEADESQEPELVIDLAAIAGEDWEDDEPTTGEAI